MSKHNVIRLTMLNINKKIIEIWQYSGLCDTEVVVINGANYIGKHAFSDSMRLRKVVINGNETFIDEGCFSYCRNLNSISLSGVKELGKASFSWCIGINELFLDVECIDAGCFFHCSSLQRVVFSPKVHKIEERAFAACYNLNNVLFLGEMPEIGTDCFFHTKITL